MAKQQLVVVTVFHKSLAQYYIHYLAPSGPCSQCLKRKLATLRVYSCTFFFTGAEVTRDNYLMLVTFTK